ncbi:MAG: hypothetical protein IPN92_11125 [Chromatiaceae bacterium]|nr:hypothetical protein [Chromatiaceae bacterium]
MIDPATSRFQGMNQPHLTAALLLAMFTLGALFTGWTVVQADRALRTDLLQRLRVAVQAVNVEHLKRSPARRRTWKAANICASRNNWPPFAPPARNAGLSI